MVRARGLKGVALCAHAAQVLQVGGLRVRGDGAGVAQHRARVVAQAQDDEGEEHCDMEAAPETETKPGIDNHILQGGRHRVDTT